MTSDLKKFLEMPEKYAADIRNLIADLRAMPSLLWPAFLERTIQANLKTCPQNFTQEEWEKRLRRMAEVAQRHVRPRPAHLFLTRDEVLFLEAMGAKLPRCGLSLTDRLTEEEMQLIGILLLKHEEKAKPDSPAQTAFGFMLGDWMNQAEAWFGEATVKEWFGAD